MSYVVICKINDRFRTALEGKRFKHDPSHSYTKKNSWGSYEMCESVIKDCKSSAKGKLVCKTHSIDSMNCCGMEELTFMELQTVWNDYKEDSDWNELVARYIKSGIPEQNDHRILVVGIPVIVGTTSMYNLDFFTKVKETLEHFGFRQIGSQYKNQNSGNTIIAMAGQL